eukprot:TRINITY_DN32986_c0_g2_i3.p3 TRINITY_DN32986_c0_g2~~TRINITY_DN32986_c0_g2_i3.p3  ORF type:complete len:124 (+),score=0.83 TRINITY_DN32986_c0_g2_i3:135-506(+)
MLFLFLCCCIYCFRKKNYYIVQVLQFQCSFSVGVFVLFSNILIFYENKIEKYQHRSNRKFAKLYHTNCCYIEAYFLQQSLNLKKKSNLKSGTSKYTLTNFQFRCDKRLFKIIFLNNFQIFQKL